ncbi:MAG: hypothetical protein ACLR1I_06310 [Ruminococcus sp.]
MAYETTVKGNNAKYSISGVASGTYTMKVSKMPMQTENTRS